MSKGQNTSEFQCFNCRNFKLSFSAFVDVFLNLNSLYTDVNTDENLMSDIKEHCCCLKVMSLSSLQLSEQ
jgi:hypothetical protein